METKIKRRKVEDKQNSLRYKNKKRATNLIKLQTDKSSKKVLQHISECKNFPNPEIAGPLTRNVPYVYTKFYKHFKFIRRYRKRIQKYVVNSLKLYWHIVDNYLMNQRNNLRLDKRPN